MNLEQRRLLFYPHKFIPYDKKPETVILQTFDLADIYWNFKIDSAAQVRQNLKLKFSAKSIIQEYKQWVDSMDINKIISQQERKAIIFELKKTRKVETYLYNLYRNLVFSQCLKKLTREKINCCNPLISYHISNYYKLHNSFRESPCNYFLPKNLSDENLRS